MTSNGLNQIAAGYATLSYKGSTHSTESTASVNHAGLNTTFPFTSFAEAAVKPFEAIKPAADVDQTIILDLQQWKQSWQWSLSGKDSFAALEQVTPLLFDPNSELAQNTDLVYKTKNGSWVHIIITSAQPSSPPHPIHKHSNKFFVIGVGEGNFTCRRLQRQSRISHSFST